jgi:hypothetical protein
MLVVASESKWMKEKDHVESENTGIGCHVGGGVEVEVPLFLLWWLKRHGVEVGGEGLQVQIHA